MQSVYYQAPADLALCVVTYYLYIYIYIYIYIYVRKSRKFDDILFRLCKAVHNLRTIGTSMEGGVFPFSKKGDLGITKDY